MRTLTLSESVFRAQLQTSCLRKPLNFTNSSSSSSSLLSLIPPHSKNQKSKHFTRASTLISSRYSRQGYQYPNANDERLGALGDYPETSSTVAHSIELRPLDDKSRKTISDPMQIQHDFVASDKTHVGISSRSKDYLSTFFKNEEAAVSNMSFCSWLKFSMLFGFLTLQGSQQAMAGSEIATGLPSIPYFGDLGDITTGFASAFLLIFFSELGDKTFFIAALLAARNSGAVVFIGTFGALATMTIVSVVLGRTFHYVDDILPFRFGETDLPIDDIAAVCLLVYFGVSTLIEAASSDGLKTEGEQREAELAVSDFSGNGAGILAAANTIISTFVLVFVAEWGDKSFFSTIALAAASSPLGVIAGATAGHAVATLLAVLGGSLLGTFLSEKIIAYVGGSLFLIFAAATVIEIVS